MVGYIYATTNLLNYKIYIGKKESPVYVESYYGSGKILKQAIKKYGKKNFVNLYLDSAETIEELNQKEKYYIDLYKSIYGRDCYNLAKGGTGGNVLYYMTDKQKKEFCDKMIIINTERARSEKYRKNISKKLRKYYSEHPEAKKNNSIKIHNYYTEERRKEWSKMIKSRDPKIKEKCRRSHFKPCAFILDGIELQFESVQELRNFLKNVYNYNPDRRTFNRLMKTTKDQPFEPYHSNKYKDLKGMVIYKIKDN